MRRMERGALGLGFDPVLRDRSINQSINRAARVRGDRGGKGAYNSFSTAVEEDWKWTWYVERFEWLLVVGIILSSVEGDTSELDHVL